MGSGHFDSTLYRTAHTVRVTTGVPHFAATAAAAVTGHWDLDEGLDPKKIKESPTSGGRNVRESRDSTEHPESIAIAVFFDQTGSMGSIPRIFQEKMDKLPTAMLTHGVDDAQILIGALGDAHSDSYAYFQVGQFESDNKMEEQLRKILLFGGGGGQTTESYDLPWYFAGHLVALDCVEKRGKKGYFFTIGDERFYDSLPATMLTKVFGDVIPEPHTISWKEIVERAQENFECFHIHVQEGTYPVDKEGHGAGERIVKGWRDSIGERLLLLDDHTLVCELIATTVAVCEGIDLVTAAKSVTDKAKDVDVLTRTLATVASVNRTRMSKATGSVPAKATTAERI